MGRSFRVLWNSKGKKGRERGKGMLEGREGRRGDIFKVVCF